MEKKEDASCNNHIKHMHGLSANRISQFCNILSGRQSHQVVQIHHSELITQRGRRPDRILQRTVAAKTSELRIFQS